MNETELLPMHHTIIVVNCRMADDDDGGVIVMMKRHAHSRETLVAHTTYIVFVTQSRVGVITYKNN